MRERFPDNGWFDGKIASWEGSRFGYRYLFEVIGDPANFKKVINSAGDDEIVELYQPTPGHRLKLTFLLTEEKPATAEPIVLNENNPTIIIPHATSYIMDATESTDPELMYTCICLGEKPKVDGET